MRPIVTGAFAALVLLLGALPLLADDPVPVPAPPAPDPAAAPASPPAPAPAPKPTASLERIERLVAQLGAPDFAVREQAGRALLEIGEPARAALERTMKQSENMEARWRAEQILRRLDHQQARPLDAESPAPPRRTPARPGASPWERAFEEFMRRLEEEHDLPGLSARSTTLEAPGLELQIHGFGLMPRVILRVEGRQQPFRGWSLDDLLVRYPDLEKLPGMAELKKKWEAWLEERPPLFPQIPEILRGPRFRTHLRLGSGSGGVTIVNDGEKVVVRITRTDSNGNQTTVEHEGESIEAILEEHPELKDELGGLTFEFLPPPRILRRNRPDPRLPLPVAPRPPEAPGEVEEAEAPFGVQIAPPEPVLATHLGLPAGRGATVHAVRKGSQAAALGLERYDVIVSANGKPVTDVDALVAALKRAARERLPITLEVVRRGERVRLTR